MYVRKKFLLILGLVLCSSALLVMAVRWAIFTPHSATSACINNLHQVDNAIQEWALENKKNAAQTVTFSDISPYLKSAVICPSGGTAFSDSYTIVDVGTKPVCQKLPAAHIFPPDTGS